MKHHEDPDPTAERALWSLIFIGLGVVILSNRPTERAGGWIAVAVVAFACAGYFLFILLVRRDG